MKTLYVCFVTSGTCLYKLERSKVPSELRQASRTSVRNDNMVYFRTMDELNNYLSIIPKTVLFNQATAQPAECGRQFRAVLNVKNKLREELSVENRFRAVLNVKNRFFHWAYFESRQLSKDTCNCQS